MPAHSWFHRFTRRPSLLRASSIGSALLLILAFVAPAQTIQAQSTSGEVVSWVHIGDLHMVDTTLSNYTDLKTIVTEINSYMKDGVNFAFLPGDNANDGATSEYQLVHNLIQNLQVPLKAVPGDHDLKAGGTGPFIQYIYPKNPDSFDIGNYHFVLLNSFDLQNELSFLTADLSAAKAAGKQSVLMFHNFDVNQLGSSLQTLIQSDNVILVDTGHTHTNVLANDGHTVYAATRSTGQATEGPVGFSLVSLDHGIVSWRFQPLGQWPFVAITSPADQGLVINGDQVIKGTVSIHTKAFSDAAISSVNYQIDGGAKVAMSDRGGALYSGSWNSTTVTDGVHTIDVSVTDANGKTGTDEIKALVNQSGSYTPAAKSFGPEGNTLPANAANGLLGASGAGGGHGGKGGPGGACTTSGTTTPTPTPTTTATTTQGGHGKGQGCGPGGAPGGHAPAVCTSSSTTTPTPTGTATAATAQRGGHGKGHGCGPGGMAAPGGGKGGHGKGHGGHGPAACTLAGVTPTATTSP